ncbi:MAG: hypothetical protein ACE5D4_08495 [Thermodesulfobacteriota bacterium]
MEKRVKPIQCSRCGSRDVWAPLNESEIEMKCMICGYILDKPIATSGSEKNAKGPDWGCEL